MKFEDTCFCGQNFQIIGGHQLSKHIFMVTIAYCNECDVVITSAGFDNIQDAIHEWYMFNWPILIKG